MKLHVEDLRIRQGSFQLEATHTFERPITALFGASGAGKTTFLELLAGLRRPDAGRIEFDGAPVADVARGIHVPARQRGIGYVPQDVALFPHLSVRDNLAYARRPAPAGTPLALAHVADVLEIDGLLDRRIAGLSGGEQQRVALGRALLAEPRVLFLDEPLARLDAARKQAALDLLRRVHAEFAIPMLYVTHAPEEVVALCDAVMVFERGRIVRSGPPDELFERTSVPQLRLRDPAR